MHVSGPGIRPLNVYVRLADTYFGESQVPAYQQNFRYLQKNNIHEHIPVTTHRRPG